MRGTVKGRVVYFEPNDFRNQLGATYGSGDNVYWQPEDLSMAVDLQVIVPDRNSCGKDIWKDVNLDISNTWTSFFRGTELNEDEPYLTDSFTDISYQEITQSGAGSKEALGIKSIDIQFDSHFYPVVKMRLIDVRGASLMMPAEYKSSHREKTCQEFFSAIFHFPYPRFALSVKGFYGSRVTFMLAVNDFQSSFNSQTGNFEAEVSFIGHMYGLYTDLPMTCLLAAPYMGVGDGTTSRYWENQKANGIFTFSDGTAIPTFKEFEEAYQTMEDKFKDVYIGHESEYKAIARIEAINKELVLLGSLSEQYRDLMAEIGRINRNGKNDCITYTNEETNPKGGFYLYFSTSNAFSLPSALNFNNTYAEYSNVVTEESDRINMPEHFKDKRWGTDRADVMPPIVNEEKYEDNGKTVIKYKLDETHTIYSRLSEDSKKQLENKIYAGKYIYKFDIDKEFEDKITKRISVLTQEKNTLLSDSSKELSDISQKILGFVPSIENIVRMVFAHIDAFMHEYYTLLDNIKQKSTTTRRSSKYRLHNIESDVDANDGDFTFPPFTGFYQEDKKTNTVVRRYPGEIPEISNFDEVKFIRRIFDAVNAFSENSDAESDSNTVGEGDETWAALSVLDILEKENPYKKFTEKDGWDYIDSLLWFVWERFKDAGLATKAYATDGKGFPVQNEVENFWKIGAKRLTNSFEGKKVIEDLRALIGGNDYSTSIITKLNKIQERVDKKAAEIKANERVRKKEKGGFYFPLDENEEIPNNFPNGCKISGLGDEYRIKLLGNFLGHIYPKDTFTIDDKDGSLKYNGTPKQVGMWEMQARASNDSYMFPVLQFLDPQSGNTGVSYDYFTQIGDRKEDTTFLASFLGTTDIYNFSSSESSIVKMSKTTALFLGSLIRNKKYYGSYTTGTTINGKFPINKEGFYTTDENSWVEELIPNVEGEGMRIIRVEDIEERDSNGELRKYYNKWAREGGVNKFCNLSKNLKSTIYRFGDKTAIEGKTAFLKEGRNESNAYTKNMVELASTNVTILSVIYNANGIFPPVTNIKNFLAGVLKKVEAANNTNNVSSGASEGNTDSVSNEREQSFVPESQSSQMYYTLKNLYDKWLACYDQERFKLNSPNADINNAYDKNSGRLSTGNKVSEIQNFMYVDTFYNDIGSTFMVDPKTIFDLLETNIEHRSAMQFIADIGQKNKLLFVALPVFTNMYDADSIASIFTPQSLYGMNEFNSGWDNSRGIGNTYVFMYTHEPSHYTVSTRNKNTVEYRGDAAVFFDENDTVPVAFSAYKGDQRGYNIPAFGVTFGKQNQMYFKNINVSMANPKETDVAIANRFQLANNERNGDSRMAPKTVGQNLFSIYSNRSYECTVDMMGCANIMPLMYFQLNNIPMFRGAYRIYGVKHHIENGTMSTTFSGIRISRNAIPFNANVIDIETLLDRMRKKNNDELSESNVNVELLAAGAVLRRNNNLPLFNVPAAINRLRKGVYIHPNGVEELWFPYNHLNFEDTPGRCAECVKNAVNAGFEGTEYYNKWISGYNGYKCRNILAGENGLNFKMVFSATTGHWDMENFEPGDIVCSNSKSSEYGHVAIFDGNVFVSDCVQTGIYSKWGGASGDQYIYEVYRYSGPIVYPSNSNYITVQFEVDEGVKIYRGKKIGDFIQKVEEALTENELNAGLVIKDSDNCSIYYVVEKQSKFSYGKILSVEVVNINGGVNEKLDCVSGVRGTSDIQNIDICSVKNKIGDSIKISAKLLEYSFERFNG